MGDATLWWIMAGVAVGVEMLTGTFYLLMLALGLGAGALAAHAGLSMTLQLVVAAVVGGGSVLGWHLLRGQRQGEPVASRNPDVNLDIGEIVQVTAWNPDRTTTVSHRGSSWSAVLPPGAATEPGAHRIREMVGNRLILEKAP